jgi:hypothetical protein
MIQFRSRAGENPSTGSTVLLAYQEDRVMKLIRYVVELDVLTLTFLQENGEELVVPIKSRTIPDQLAMDIMDLIYGGDGISPFIDKITRNIDPSDGTIRKSPQDVEHEGKRVKLPSHEDLIEVD